MDDDRCIDEMMEKHFGIFKQIGFLWPTYNKKMILYTIFYTLLLVAHSISIVVSFFHLTNVLHSLFFNIIYLLLALLAGSVAVLLNRSREAVKSSLLIVARGFFKYDEPVDATVSRTINARLRSQLKLLLIVPASSIMTGSIVCFHPLLDTYLGVPAKQSDVISFNLPIHFWYPFSTENGSWGKYVALIAQGAFVTSILLILLCAETLYVYVSRSIFYELEILAWSVDNFNARVEFLANKYRDKFGRDDVTNRQIFSEYCIIENIRHHHIIRNCVKDFVKFCDPMLFQAWSIGTTTVALTLFEFSQMNLTGGAVAASGSLVIAEILNMFILSKIGQQMNDLTENLYEKVAFMKWYTMNAKMKRNVSIFMIGTSLSNSYTAGGLFQMNFPAYSSAMNTAYSYFNLLSAAKKQL